MPLPPEPHGFEERNPETSRTETSHSGWPSLVAPPAIAERSPLIPLHLRTPPKSPAPPAWNPARPDEVANGEPTGGSAVSGTQDVNPWYWQTTFESSGIRRSVGDIAHYVSSGELMMVLAVTLGTLDESDSDDSPFGPNDSRITARYLADRGYLEIRFREGMINERWIIGARGMIDLIQELQHGIRCRGGERLVRVSLMEASSRMAHMERDARSYRKRSPRKHDDRASW